MSSQFAVKPAARCVRSYYSSVAPRTKWAVHEFDFALEEIYLRGAGSLGVYGCRIDYRGPLELKPLRL